MRVSPRFSNTDETYPLTPMQSAMLYHNLLTPNSGMYLEQVICELNQPLDCELLERAWNKVIERHAVLRTRIRIADEKNPAQQIQRRADITLRVENWTDLTPESQADQFQLFLEQDLRRDFDLVTVPMRWSLFQWGASQFRLLWTFHHALLDGRSTRLVLKEVFAFYDSFVMGRELHLAPAVPFRDYVHWLRQNHHPDSPRFWQEQLREYSPTQLLVKQATFNNTSVQNTAAVVETRLSYEVSEKLRAIAQEHDLTMNTLVQGTWAQVLSRYSDSEDVIFGATRALRHADFEGVQDLVGVLINTVPLRIAAPPDLSLLHFLKKVRAQWIDMRPYEHATLSQILQWADTSPKAQPLSSLVVCENNLLDTAMRELFANRSREFRSRSVTNFPLTVVAFAEPQWILKIGFRQSQFDIATVRRMLGHLQELLEKTPDALHQPLKTRSMLTESERQERLFARHQTRQELSHADCVHRLFERQVERTPDAVAVDCPDNDLSNFELNQRANRLAHHLQRRGVRDESLVGFCLPRSPSIVIAMLAIQKAGGAYVPLDPASPQPRLASMIEQAGITVIVTVADFAERWADSGVEIICLDSAAEILAKEPTSNLVSNVNLEHLAYAVFTSGSTGQPKGILISHRALLNHTWALIKLYDISARDRRLQLVSTGSDVLIAEVFPYLLTGGTIVVRSRTNSTSIAEFVNCLDEAQITIVGVPSALWHEWVLSFAEQDACLPKSLRVVISGMDQVRPDLFDIWRKKVRGQIRWFNAYGPSETTCTTTVYEADLASNETLSCVPIGRPISNVQVYLLDKHRNPVPVGVPGEIFIGGDGLARGYLNQPDLTAEKFIEDQQTRLYKSGDLGRYREDGNIEFLGRADQQVKLRGYRIELGEIEAVLNDLPDVAQSVVILREDHPGEQRLVAYCVPHAKRTLRISAVRRHLLQRLPDYMIPTGLVLSKTLPLTPSGKVNRLALPVPETSRPELEIRFVAARTALERQLAAIWCELLGVETVGIHDNFFDLGGNSLKAVALFDRMIKVCGQNLPLAILIECPTIAQLVGTLQEPNGLPQWKSLVPIQSSGSQRPLFLVPPASGTVIRFTELAKHLGSDYPVYGLEPLGHDDRYAPLNRVEAMASCYVEEIRAFQPTGPYLLAGICFGAHVAWEMARQLTDQGLDVALVVLLDANPPASGPTWSRKINVQDSRSLVQAWKFGSILKSILRRTFRRMNPVRIFKDAVQRLGRLRSRLDGSSDRHTRMIEAHNRALVSYLAQCYAGHVLLVQSEESSRSPVFVERWSQIAVGRFEHVVVPGTSHLDLLMEGPFTPLLGQLLREHLDRADSTSANEPTTIPFESSDKRDDLDQLKRAA